MCFGRHWLKALGQYIRDFYVGKRRPSSGVLADPRSPPHLWNVSGMASRTNNAAESVHAHMNPKVSRVLSVLNFIRIIEEEMNRTNERIRTECKSERRAVEGAKNRLLGVELQKLLIHDRGILKFLDNCGSVVALRSLADANSFVPHTIQGVEDVEWIPANRPQVRAAGLALHQRLCPGNQIDAGDVLRSVASWAFQIPPGPHFFVGPSERRLSLANQGPRKSYAALSERLEREYCGRGNGGSQTEEREDRVVIDGDEDGQNTTVV